MIYKFRRLFANKTMFSSSVPKKRKNEIKYLIKGLINDVDSQRNNYHKVCNDKEFILRSLLNDNENNDDSIGAVEFDAYIESLTRIKNRLYRKEKRFENDTEERYYDKQLKKILFHEAEESNFLINQYNTIKDVFPFFDDSTVLFDLFVREIKRKKIVNDLIEKALEKK